MVKKASACLAVLLVVPMALHAERRSEAECRAAGNTTQREPSWWAADCGYILPDSQRFAQPDPNAVNPGDPAWHVDLRSNPDRLMTFALPDAHTAVLVANTLSQFFYGVEHDSPTQVLYAVDATTLQLGTINKATAAFTPLYTITGIAAGHNVTGLAFVTYAGGPVYLSTSDGAVSNLYTINTATGAATLVGATGTALMIDIAINAGGQMYGMDIATDMLYSIDTATGAATQIGLTGFNANFAQSLDFDKTTGLLYGWLYIGAGVNHFVQYNLATGAASIVNSPTNIEAEGALTPVTLESFSAD